MVDAGPVSADMVTAARQLAEGAHTGQVDKAGAAYIDHPARVAARVSGDLLAEQVAWLHDVVEDTAVTLDDLRERGFGEEVVVAVDAMSRREGEVSDDYYRRVAAVPLALTVKFADLSDNSDPQRLAVLTPEVRMRLQEKYTHARRVLRSSATELVRTATSRMLHVWGCPHVGRFGLVVATEQERRTMPVCSLCQLELDGVGRTYFDTIEDAMRAFGSYADTWVTIGEHVRRVEHDQIWVPNSSSYIALGDHGPAVMWVGKTYVQHAGGEFVELPGYDPASRGGQGTSLIEAEICPTCFMEMPLTGRCDTCG